MAVSHHTPRHAWTIAAIVTFTIFDVHAQPTYQRQFIAGTSDGSVRHIVFGNVRDSSATLMANAGLMELNINSGVVTGGRKMTVNGTQPEILDAFGQVSAIYGLLRPQAAGGDTSYLMKYSLTSNSAVWTKKIVGSFKQVMLTSVTGDKNGNLYLAGYTYDAVDGYDACAMKVDTSGNAVWTVSFANHSDGLLKPQITYNGDRELYVVFTAWTGSPFGIAHTMRLDTGGALLDNKAVAGSPGGPRFSYCYPVILNNHLCVVNSTISGPSDPGPLLVQIVDSSLNVTRQKIVTGLSAGWVCADSATLLISGQAYVTSGIPGFRSARLDTALNITSAAHFNKIATYSVSAMSYSVFLPGHRALHFFTHSGDTIHIALANEEEQTLCRAVPYSPGIYTSIGAYDTLLAISTMPLAIHLDDIPSGVVAFADVPISTLDPCADESSVYEQGLGEVIIFPNPAGDVLHLPVHAKTATIYGIDGRMMITVAAQETVDLSALKPGIYVINITTGTGNAICRFTKL